MNITNNNKNKNNKNTCPRMNLVCFSFGKQTIQKYESCFSCSFVTHLSGEEPVTDLHIKVRVYLAKIRLLLL